MEINNFMDKFSNQFEDADIKNIKIDSEFRKMNSWDSLTGFAIMEFIKDDYQINITVDEFKTVKTPGELFNLVLSKR